MSTGLTRDIIAQLAPIHHGSRPVLQFVTGVLLAERGRQGNNPLDGIDVEEVMTALDLLANRKNLEISPFVGAWDHGVGHFDQSAVTSRDAENAIGKIFNFSQPSFSDGKPLIELIRNIAGMSSTGANYRRAREASIATLITVLQDHEDVSYLKPIFRLADSQTHCTVATLNYDRTLEDAAYESDVRMDTGIDHWTSNGEWSFNNDAPVHLLKLHGSIDWIEEDIHTDALPEARFRTRRDDDQFPNFRGVRPGMIFGGANKLRADGPYLELLSRWEDVLTSSDNLIVVGYSFRDDHINEILRRWVNRGPHRRMVVIDPEARDLRQFGKTNFISQLQQDLLGEQGWSSSAAEHPPRHYRLIQLAHSAQSGLPIALSLIDDDAADIWEPPSSRDAFETMQERVKALSTG